MEELVISPDFWRGRRVLLTGHTGFKGAWLSMWLQSIGAHVSGLSLPPASKPNLYTLADVGRDMASAEVDIRDFAGVRRAIMDVSPDVVIHLAAQSLVRHSYHYPVDTFATNVIGSVHVLEALRLLNRRAVAVVITSDKCYENRGWEWGYREVDRLGGKDPYSASKACAELVAASYRDSFFADGRVAVATARAGNVIGGGDWADDRLIPDMVRAVQQGQPIILRNPQAIRPWQHVLEPLAGYLLLAQHLWEEPQRYVGAWNFGPAQEDALPVEEMVSRFVGYWGQGKWIVQPDHRLAEAAVLRLDAARAMEHLGWRRHLTIDSALEWTAEWYRAYAAGADVRSLTEMQIERYQRLQ